MHTTINRRVRYITINHGYRLLIFDTQSTKMGRVVNKDLIHNNTYESNDVTYSNLIWPSTSYYLLEWANGYLKNWHRVLTNVSPFRDYPRV